VSRAPLRYHQPLPLGGRIILGIGAAIPLYGFYDLLIRPGVPWFDWGMAPFLAMGFIALAFGLVFLSLAVFSGSRTVIIDRNRLVCVVEFDGTFGLQWRFPHPFSTLGPVRAAEFSTSKGPPHWGVQFPRERGKPIIVASYREEAAARAEAEKIAAYMAGR
jgi:hypothetical protein